MIDTDLAWSAGLIDGEGCIRISKVEHTKKSTTYDLWLTVGMCHKESIIKLYDIFEFGSLRVDNSPSRKTPLWVWQCSTHDTVKVLKQIMPWLTCKRKEAELALDFVIMKSETNSNGKRLTEDIINLRDTYYWRMRNLKMNGGRN